MKRPKILGKIVYLTGYPFIYRHLRNSQRVYVLIRVKNKVLLTKNWLGLHRHWRLPGGGVKTGEATRQAAVREVAEEIGIKLDPKQLKLLTQQCRKAKKCFYYNIYEIWLKDEPAIHQNGDEITHAQFFTLDKIKALQLSEITSVASRLLE